MGDEVHQGISEQACHANLLNEYSHAHAIVCCRVVLLWGSYIKPGSDERDDQEPSNEGDAVVEAVHVEVAVLHETDL